MWTPRAAQLKDVASASIACQRGRSASRHSGNAAGVASDIVEVLLLTYAQQPAQSFPRVFFIGREFRDRFARLNPRALPLLERQHFTGNRGPDLSGADVPDERPGIHILA